MNLIVDEDAVISLLQLLPHSRWNDAVMVCRSATSQARLEFIPFSSGPRSTLATRNG